MKYYLFEQQNDGCDYTIGCGLRLTEIPGVKTMDEACLIVSGFKDDYGEHSTPWLKTEGECSVQSAKILEVSDEFQIDLINLTLSRRAKKRQKEDQAEQEREKREYERLQAKFGK